MRSKLKLAFDELEKELTIITQSELMQLMGGTGSGYDIDAVLGQIASDLIAMGFPLTESSGNYYFNSSGNGIMLEAVEVYAYSTGMNSSGDGHSGYSSGLGGGDGPLDMVIGYLQNMGFSFSYSNGSYSYHNNNNNNSSSNSSSDPWKRDSNQNIIAERTQTPAFQYDTYGVDMTMEEFELTAQDNTKVKVYKVTSVVDPVTGLPRNPTEAEKANCLGFAMTGDDYWVLDNPSTLGKDEGLITRSDIIGWYGYEVCDKSEASLVVVYDGTNAIHAGIVNADGTYDAKGGVREIVRGMGSEAEFLKPYGDNGPSYAEGDVLYYKKKD